MVDTLAPDAFDAPVVDALVVAALAAFVVTLGGLFDLEPTVTGGAAVLGVGGYAAFRLIYALERIADALEDPEEEEPRRAPPRSSTDRSSSRS